MPPYRGQFIEQSLSANLASAALALTYTMLKDGWLHWAGFKASANITETAALKVRPGGGANYDLTAVSENLVAGASFWHKPPAPIFVKKGHIITLSCTNANTTGIVYGTLMIEEIETYN